ncbi:MAG TPA: biotin--[acetyl-CoA-carboxylase] ligase [Oscillospiraceae bacterium]|nr:biotin--[acetyl-CoA-carboxylase] ligase [Oscillospiraceae bacterium]
MKGKILRLLKENREKFLSGVSISRQLQVSRTAIWKYISVLRDDGYRIKSVAGRGYQLQTVPDLLTPLEIDDGLRTKVLGQQIKYFQEIDSTNRVARKLAQAGAADGLLVIAEKQKAGRGRLGRTWSSPSGGIWFSLILRPPLPPFKVQGLTLLTAVVAVETTALLCGLNVGIKWPNDLIVNGKKLAGILTEVSAEIERLHYVVVGLGLNANVSLSQLPAEVETIATSILAETKRPLRRAEWIQTFLQRFEAAYQEAVVNGFAEILARWRRYSITLGRTIVIHAGGKLITGRAVDINEQGALLVETKNGVETFWAGDVSLSND